MNKLEALLALAELVGDDQEPPTRSQFPYMDKVAIRTVTHYYTGRVTAASERFVLLDEAAWIADTGRWYQFVADGTYNEAEYAGEVAVAIGAIVDVVPWKHELPKTK